MLHAPLNFHQFFLISLTVSVTITEFLCARIAGAQSRCLKHVQKNKEDIGEGEDTILSLDFGEIAV